MSNPCPSKVRLQPKFDRLADVQGVIHGDLCRGNVLMAASTTSPSGFDIKVRRHMLADAPLGTAG